MDINENSFSVEYVDTEIDPIRHQFKIIDQIQNTFYYKFKTTENIYQIISLINKEIQWSDIFENIQTFRKLDGEDKWVAFCDIINQLLLQQYKLPLDLKKELEQQFMNEAIPFKTLMQNEQSSMQLKKKVVQITETESSSVNSSQSDQPRKKHSHTMIQISNKGILKQKDGIQRSLKSQYPFRESNRNQKDDNQVLSQYIKVDVTEQEINFDKLNSAEAVEKFLKTLMYTELRIVGQGATTITYKALNRQGQIVAVKVLQKSEGGLQAALLFRSLNQDNANNLTGHTLFQHHILEVADILVIEEDLANETLEDILQKKAMKGERFNMQEVRSIIVDLAEQLYTLHFVKGCVHNDIKPENILVKGGKFILHDLGVAEKIENVKCLLLPNTQTQIQDVVGTLLYMSPAKLDHYHFSVDNKLIDATSDLHISSISEGFLRVPSATLNRKCTRDQKQPFFHNPFKSDMFSFGLLILRLILHNNNITMNVQIENIFFHNRNPLLNQTVEKYPFYFHEEKLFLFQGEVRAFRNILELLLDQDEDKRVNILDFCLFLNTQQNILRQIITPHAKTFTPNVQAVQDFYRVTYEIKKLVYEGDFDVERQERTGTGVIFLTDEKFWEKNRYQNQGKNSQTIQEEDEVAVELSLMDSRIFRANNQVSFTEKSNLLNKILSQLESEYKKLLLYSGEWLKNLPNGEGTLSLYQNSTVLSYIRDRKITKTNEIKSNETKQELKLITEIESEFYLGNLNGNTTFRIDRQIIENYYQINISQQFLRNISEQQLQFGVYTFVQEPYSKHVFGYFDSDMIFIVFFYSLSKQEKNIYLIDVRDVEINKDICKVLKTFLEKLNFKLEKMSYTKDNIIGIGILDLQGFKNMKEINIFISFAESDKGRKIVNRSSLLNSTVQFPKLKTHGSTFLDRLCQCFKPVSSKKKKMSRIQTEFQSLSGDTINSLKSDSIPRVAKDFTTETLSAIVDCIITTVSLENLDSLDLRDSYLAQDALQRLEDLSQFTRISDINLCRCQNLMSKQLEKILLSSSISYLKTLNLSFIKIKDSLLECIVLSENLNQLQKLYIAGCKDITSLGLKNLFCSTKMKKIIVLDISSLKALDDSTLALIRPEQFQSLRELIFNDSTALTINGFIKFLKGDMIQKLWKLSCTEAKLIENTLSAKTINKSQFTEINITQNLRELSFYNLFLLDKQCLSAIAQIKFTRLKSLNLIYAFEQKYSFELLQVVSILSKKETKFVISQNYNSHSRLSKTIESKNMSSLSKSQLPTSKMEFTQTDKSSFVSEEYKVLLLDMDELLIDCIIPHSMFVHLNAAKIQILEETQNHTLIYPNDIILLDLCHKYNQPDVLLALAKEQTISFLTYYSVESAYIDVNTLNKDRTIEILNQIQLSLPKWNIKGLQIVFSDQMNNLELIEYFLSELCQNQAVQSQVYSLTLISQVAINSVLSYLKLMNVLMNLKINNSTINYVNRELWEGFSINPNSIGFLRYKLEQVSSYGTIDLEKQKYSTLSQNSIQSYDQLNRLNDDTLKQLAQGEGLQRLEKLQFKQQRLLTDKGIEYVLTSSNTALVHTIDLSFTNVTGQVFILINSSQGLENLANVNIFHINFFYQLFLNGCNLIDYKDFLLFVESPSAQRLRSFEMSSSKINTVDQFFLTKKMLSLEKIKIIFNHAKEDKFPIEQIPKSENIFQVNFEDTEENLTQLCCLHLDFSNIQCQRIYQILKILKNRSIEKVLLDLSNQGVVDEILIYVFSCFQCLRNSLKEFALSLNKDRFKIIPGKLPDLNERPEYFFCHMMDEFLLRNNQIEYFHINLSKPKIQEINDLQSGETENYLVMRLFHSISLIRKKLIALDIALENCKKLSRSTVSTVVDTLKSFKQIQNFKLNLAGCIGLDTQDLSSVGRIFSQWSNLEKLTLILIRCQVQDETINELLEWVLRQEKNGFLQKITINLESCNYVTGEGFKTLLKKRGKHTNSEVENAKCVRINLFLGDSNVKEQDLFRLQLLKNVRLQDSKFNLDQTAYTNN